MIRFAFDDLPRNLVALVVLSLLPAYLRAVCVRPFHVRAFRVPKSESFLLLHSESLLGTF